MGANSLFTALAVPEKRVHSRDIIRIAGICESMYHRKWSERVRPEAPIYVWRALYAEVGNLCGTPSDEFLFVIQENPCQLRIEMRS